MVLSRAGPLGRGGLRIRGYSSSTNRGQRGLKRQSRNASFLLGTGIGAAVGFASSMYIHHYMLPSPSPSPSSSFSFSPSNRHFGNAKALANAIAELQVLFPVDGSTVDATDLTIHGSSSWFPMHNQGVPNIVVYPQSTADVQKIVKVASKYLVPVISYGAGTSIEGQFSPPYGGICIDFSGMDEIHAIERDDMTVTLGPGVGWQTLNAELDARETGLFFPVDPGPGATIGGCIGTSCSGPNAARYGTMKEWVLNMTVVTIDGRVFRTRSMAKKSSTGYDLNRLLIGAEGTLGLVTEITLKLTNKPAHEIVGTCAFDHVEDVTRLVMRAKRMGLDAQCLELLDGMNMPAINSFADGAFPPFPTKPHLFFKLSGARSTIEEERKALGGLCKQEGGQNFNVAATSTAAAQLWGARKNLLLASLAANKDCVALSTDVCVPISKLPALVKDYRAMSKKYGLVSSILGHVADGNFHSLILYDDRDPEQVKRAYALSEELCRLSLALGGTVSGEHGVGSTKRKFMIDEYGATGIDMMTRIKYAWDPHGLLNPGKLLPDRIDLRNALRKESSTL